MRKLVAALATGVIFTGIAATSVSAEEYEVEKGDSLWAIAEAYNTNVDNLMELNGLEDPVIHPKQKIFINETYTVEKGDTLSDIAKEFDVSVKDIKKWNDLDSDLIVIDQKLEIKGMNAETVKEKQPKAKQTKAATTTKPAAKKQAATKQAPAKKASAKNESTNKASEGKTLTVTATAYTAKCDGCSGVTSTGIDLNANPNAKVIAVDPSVIPLGSKVYVEGYGEAIAGDTGGAIKGNKIDLHVPTKDKAYSWGVRTVKVTILK
ncbi:LysM peptidoglycan-binding domain-containing protein [Ornithinibacillus gellani]|uniref:3D domain-containing protein n=1 Tax=Ornithinibacillus gellani TaxID=2293253 RepID=UPI000F496D02|nr:3D domain-containing protein [Ornithinibacillus gellani]TQS72070.1 LysM peptidoglycan-binding domain-containing protein [Ornithinibacillus gellani]